MKPSYDSDRFPVRKNPRMKAIDYSAPNYYFITICTWDKVCLFGGPGRLNHYGKIAEQGLSDIETHFPSVTIDKYVVMPNHIHAVVILTDQTVHLSTVIGQYKSYVSRQIHQQEPERHVWQASYHDHVIRNQNSYERIWLYIDSNPLNWEKDCFFHL